jgi:formate-dependent nitrite reductase cytochrome c552 subunit
MYEYYAKIPHGFVMDWQHPDSRAKMLKAQHPDFEFFSRGVHAKSGVSCAYCRLTIARAHEVIGKAGGGSPRLFSMTNQKSPNPS